VIKRQAKFLARILLSVIIITATAVGGAYVYARYFEPSPALQGSRSMPFGAPATFAQTAAYNGVWNLASCRWVVNGSNQKIIAIGPAGWQATYTYGGKTVTENWVANDADWSNGPTTIKTATNWMNIGFTTDACTAAELGRQQNVNVFSSATFTSAGQYGVEHINPTTNNILSTSFSYPTKWTITAQ